MNFKTLPGKIQSIFTSTGIKFKNICAGFNEAKYMFSNPVAFVIYNDITRYMPAG